MNYLKKKMMPKSSMDGSGDGHLRGGGTFVHGHIFLEIRAAKNLPDMESFISKLYDRKDVTDAFVDVRLGNAKVAKTSIIDNSLNPEWNESYRIEVCHLANELAFEIRDKDHAYTEFIGVVRIPTSALLNGAVREGWFPIMKKENKPYKDAELNLSVRFVSKSAMEHTYQVDCYFPMHRNCRVTLYQDAHSVPDLPQFSDFGLANPSSCWADIYHSLIGAEHIICINGWAVWHQLKLFRGSDLAIDQRTLGEILTDKANRGLQVYVMLWSEKTSGDILGQKGFMGTHDMETFNYFKKSKVNCALAPRTMSVNELTDVFQNEFSSGAYTHHQKSIVCDAPGPAGFRRLIAYVGGLDLTGGRWDTQNHELYSTLLNEHLGDFRNSDAKSVPPEQGPREPWHDIHSRVEGSIAHDVFLNFYERWAKQGTKYGQLQYIDRKIIDVDCPPPLDDPSQEWNCQLFRSITSDSAVLDPNLSSHLNSKKGRMVDSSIAQAYIQTIRNAQNFLYIENQYFLGSAYSWLQNYDVNCHHTIPSEIAQKIVDKIYLGQRFIAYIVIPMFPEGDPSSAPIQEILYWQFRTMEMMYARVAEALQQVGSTDHPTDWLLFLCPGKREAPGPHLDQLEPPTEANATVFRNTLRFPIYVHSKMMIADDAYIIVGSANINQRSMAGTRDTEIAVGSWQPSFTPDNPYGGVHNFRMSLFAEHFRYVDPSFRYPATMECVGKVKEMAFHNWTVYSGPELIPTPGQLLSYPLNVLADGKLEYLENTKTFPDFGSGAKIMGTISAVIPQKVTT